MASGRFELNSRLFTERNLTKVTPYKLSQIEQLSYPTLLRYLTKDGGYRGDVRRFDGRVLYSILVTGMGMSPEEVENMRVGDLFELVSEGELAAK